MNINRLTIGSKVIMGSGKVLTVVNIEPHSNKNYSVLVTFSNGMKRSFMPNGKHHYGTTKHDIVGVVRVKKNSVLRSSGYNNH